MSVTIGFCKSFSQSASDQRGDLEWKSFEDASTTCPFFNHMLTLHVNVPTYLFKFEYSMIECLQVFSHTFFQSFLQVFQFRLHFIHLFLFKCSHSFQFSVSKVSFFPSLWLRLKMVDNTLSASFCWLFLHAGLNLGS